jgi:hypothetical protein
MLADELRESLASEDELPDTGPFAFVQVFADVSVMVRIGEHAEIQLPGPAGGEHAAQATTDNERAAPPVGAASEAEGGDGDAAQRTLDYFLEAAGIW